MKTNFKKWSPERRINMFLLGVAVVGIVAVYAIELFK